MKSHARTVSKIAVVLVGLFGFSLANAAPAGGVTNAVPLPLSFSTAGAAPQTTLMPPDYMPGANNQRSQRRPDDFKPVKCTGTKRQGGCGAGVRPNHCPDDYLVIGDNHYQCSFGPDGLCSIAILCYRD